MNLTPRQMEAVMTVARKGTYKDAAVAMGVTTGRIHALLHEAYIRLDVERWSEAVYRLWLAELWGEQP